MGVEAALRLEAGYPWGVLLLGLHTKSQNRNVFIGIGSSLSTKAAEHTAETGLYLESYVLRAAVSAAQVFMWWKCKAKFLMVVEGQQLLPSLALIAGFLAIIRIVNINSYTVLSCSSHSSKIMLAILHVHKHKCMCLTVWELQPFWTSPKWVPWILTSLSLSLPAQPQQDHLILPSSH